jgi:hypothetical protein
MEKFEKEWQSLLDERVNQSGVVKYRRDMYSKKCLQDMKEVARRIWISARSVEKKSHLNQPIRTGLFG